MCCSLQSQWLVTLTYLSYIYRFAARSLPTADLQALPFVLQLAGELFCIVLGLTWVGCLTRSNCIRLCEIDGWTKIPDQAAVLLFPSMDGPIFTNIVLLLLLYLKALVNFRSLKISKSLGLDDPSCINDFRSSLSSLLIFCRVQSGFLLLASTRTSWLSWQVKVFTKHPTMCWLIDCTICRMWYRVGSGYKKENYSFMQAETIKCDMMHCVSLFIYITVL